MSAPRYRPFLLFVTALVVASAGLIAPASAQQGPMPGTTAPGPPRQPAPPRQNEMASGFVSPRTPHPKVDSRLADPARTARETGEGAGLQVAKDRKLPVRNGRVRVVVEAVDAAAARSVILRAGGTVDREAGRQLQALVPLSALGTIAAQPSVRYVRPPSRPVPLAVTDEGVAASGATAWTSAGITGAGVKIAVLDIGFQNYAARQASGDLPANVVTKDFCQPDFDFENDRHGTGVAEIVHKMAPDAQLYLICVGYDDDLVTAKDWIKAQSIQIVNHSVAWYGPFNGDGSGDPSTPNGVVADASASGILWVNAAGNSAAGQHWSGTFLDTNGDDAHEFAPGDEGNTVFIGSGRDACFYMTWDDWPLSSQDYDLYLVRSSDLNTPVAYSENVQTGTQPPFEGLCYTNQDASQSFAVFIVKYDATKTPRFDLWSPDVLMQYSTVQGSIDIPASSPSAFAVGAICWSSNTPEGFSSQGPTIDGRIKPDIAATDAVSSATYGPGSSSACSGFIGTSAAAPHVAGAAALVKQANPSFTASQLRSFLTGRAIDMGAAGVDNQFGSGRLNLGNPPVTPTMTPTTTPTATATPTVTATPTPPATAVLNGSVVLQGRQTGTAAYQVPLQVTIFQKDTSIIVASGTPTTLDNGTFSVADLQPGSYDIKVKQAQAISKTVKDVTLGAGTNPSVSFGTLLSGDINNDDAVSLQDYNVLRSNFGKCTQTGYDPKADLDGDGCIALSDYNLLRMNFGQHVP